MGEETYSDGVTETYREREKERERERARDSLVQ